MVVTLTHTSVNIVFYSAATALIRYIYIKTSLQTNIQAVIKRNAFMWKSVFIIESLGCYNLRHVTKWQFHGCIIRQDRKSLNRVIAGAFEITLLVIYNK